MAAYDRPNSGYLGDTPSEASFEVMVIDNMAHRVIKLVVHEFSVGDVEDPDLYAGEPLWKWQQSDDGRWVMENAVETPMWHRMQDNINWGYRYAITAKLKEVDAVLWRLRQ
jgi:hypothetical protein